jgi:hypothetical protein
MKEEDKSKFYDILGEAMDKVGVVIIPIDRYERLVNQTKVIALEKELAEQKQAFADLFEEKKAIVITYNPLAKNDMVIKCYPKEEIPEIKEIKKVLDGYERENEELRAKFVKLTLINSDLKKEIEEFKNNTGPPTTKKKKIIKV